MIKALRKDGAEKPPKVIKLKVTVSSLNKKFVANFVTRSSLCFFEMLSLSTKFLAVDPQELDSQSDYQFAFEFVKAVKVVNDCAEHSVALMQ